MFEWVCGMDAVLIGGRRSVGRCTVHVCALGRKKGEDVLNSKKRGRRLEVLIGEVGQKLEGALGWFQGCIGMIWT
jgi:hypothetical protein